MSNDMMVANANSLMRSGAYDKALVLYEKIKSHYKTSAFDLNIELCKKHIKKNLAPAPAPASNFDSQNKNRICLLRIIGNDLPGLHDSMQSYRNLEFILKNEPNFPGVDKFFIINRIVSESKKNRIKWLLNKYEKEYVEINFKAEEYIDIPFNQDGMPDQQYWASKDRSDWERLLGEVLKRKNRNAYLINNNGARNFALDIGISKGYEWILPFDGNCFLSEKQFKDLSIEFKKSDNKNYIIIPMERCHENIADLAKKCATNAVEEPQIAFRRTANLKFDEKRVYGNQPKVDLFKRLGVPGPWDGWVQEYPWKLFEFKIEKEETSLWKTASSVFRLSSGNTSATASAKSRGNARANAILSFLDDVYVFSRKIVNNKSTIDYEYYHSVEEKSLNYSNNKFSVNDIFDKIYLVSLEKDVEKRLKVENQLKDLGLIYQNVKATNGYVGEPLERYKEYIKIPAGNFKVFKDYSEIEKKRKSKLIESAGAMGYIYTYIGILEDARKNKYKNILILEDDVIFCKNFINRFESFYKSIEKDWKIIQLGASQYGWRSVDFLGALSKGFHHPAIHDTKGSFAIAFNESIYDELIENQRAFEAPFDHLPIGVLYEKYKEKCFTAFPYLVMPDVSISTIRGKRDQHEHANRMKWWMGDFEYPQRKLNVGLILNASRNVKYLKSSGVLESLPFILSFYSVSQNGVLPLHDINALDDSYQVKGNASIDALNISVDYLFEVPDDVILTSEILVQEIEKCIEGKSNEYLLRKDVKETSVVKGRVSVIVPTYKRPENLATAIDSVLSQRYQNIELIVVDDNGIGSEFEKETKSIIKKCAEKYPKRNLRYIQHKVNANGANARNTGIVHSTGEYICFLDDDDIYLPGRIYQSVEALELHNNDCGAVYCGFLGWNSKALDVGRFATGDLTKELLSLEYSKHYLHTNTATYRREAIFRINGFDSSYRRHQDLEFNLRFFEQYKIQAVKKCLVRLSPQKSQVDNKIYGQDFFRLKNKFLNGFSKAIESFDDETRKEIYLKNWKEVIRYSKNIEEFMKEIESDFSNGALQLLLISEKK